MTSVQGLMGHQRELHMESKGIKHMKLTRGLEVSAALKVSQLSETLNNSVTSTVLDRKVGILEEMTSAVKTCQEGWCCRCLPLL